MSIAEIEDRYMDMLEAARLLRIHPQSLRRLVKDGKGPRATLFGGKYLLARDEVERFRITYDGRPGRKPRARRLL